MNVNRCPRCGGIARTMVTDLRGRSFYHCSTGLTSFQKDGQRIKLSSQVIPCDTILSPGGRVFTGTIGYRTGEGTQAIGVTDGRVRK